MERLYITFSISTIHPPPPIQFQSVLVTQIFHCPSHPINSSPQPSIIFLPTSLSIPMLSHSFSFFISFFQGLFPHPLFFQYLPHAPPWLSFQSIFPLSSHISHQCPTFCYLFLLIFHIVLSYPHHPLLMIPQVSLPHIDRACPHPSGGGGQCRFEGRYPLPNYRPRFSGLSVPEFSLTAPYFWDLQTTTL